MSRLNCEQLKPSSCNGCDVYRDAGLKLRKLSGNEKPSVILTELSKEHCPEGRKMDDISYIIK